MNQSDAVQTMIKDSYKQTRRDDDRNQPRSVQPWFSDQYRRKYWLVEGLEDSHFRIYRENDGKTAKTNTWFSVAGSIQDVTMLADKFGEEHTQNSKVISDKLRSAIPRFEAGEEVCHDCGNAIVSSTDMISETKATRLSPSTQGCIYTTRSRVLRVRRTYTREEDEIHFFG